MRGSTQAKTLPKAKQAVQRLLKMRFQSEKEVVQKLRRNGFEAPVIEDTIDYYKNLGLIDDKRFARLWINSRLAKPLGLMRIRFELIEKGIDKDIIDEAFKELKGDYQEEAIVKRLSEKQILKYRGISKTKVKQRLFAYLRQRGFSYDASLKFIKDV